MAMKINPTKASAMVFSKRRNENWVRPVCYSGVEITFLDSVKILGVTLDSGLAFTNHAESFQESQGKSFSTVQKLGRAGQWNRKDAISPKAACVQYRGTVNVQVIRVS